MAEQKQKIYLAGPITGHVDGNRKIFGHAKKLVEAMGYAAINPHDIAKWLEGKSSDGSVTERKIMATCLQIVCDRADVMLVLEFGVSSYGDSAGTMAEVMAATKCKIPVFVVSKTKDGVTCEMLGRKGTDAVDLLPKGSPWWAFPEKFVEATKKARKK